MFKGQGPPWTMLCGCHSPAAPKPSHLRSSHPGAAGSRVQRSSHLGLRVSSAGHLHDITLAQPPRPWDGHPTLSAFCSSTAWLPSEHPHTDGFPSLQCLLPRGLPGTLPHCTLQGDAVRGHVSWSQVSRLWSKASSSISSFACSEN